MVHDKTPMITSRSGILAHPISRETTLGFNANELTGSIPIHVCRPSGIRT